MVWRHLLTLLESPASLPRLKLDPVHTHKIKPPEESFLLLTSFYFIDILTYIHVYLMNNENALLLKWGNTLF